MKIFAALLDLLYPVACPGCGKETRPEAPWCEDCIRKFWHPRLIADSASPHLSGCYTCCQYTEGIRSAIIRLKYGKKEHLAGAFPPLLARFPWWERIEGFDLAVPVPLAKARRKERGFNQTDLIFRKAMEEKGKTYDADLLVRIRDTKVQSLLDKEDREKNLKGAFHINKGKNIKGRRILLLDDVYTTGTTMKEAAKELRRAGAAEVMGFAAASGAR